MQGDIYHYKKNKYGCRVINITTKKKIWTQRDIYHYKKKYGCRVIYITTKKQYIDAG